MSKKKAVSNRKNIAVDVDIHGRLIKLQRETEDDARNRTSLFKITNYALDLGIKKIIEDKLL